MREEVFDVKKHLQWILDKNTCNISERVAKTARGALELLDCKDRLIEQQGKEMMRRDTIINLLNKELDIYKYVASNNAKQPEFVARFKVNNEWINDYRCGVCGMGIAREYKCCPYCENVIDWRLIEKSEEVFDMASIYVKMKDGTTKEFLHEGRAGGSYTKSIRYDGAFAIIKDEYDCETAIPVNDISEIKVDREKRW